MSTKITNEQLAARQTKTKRKEEAGAADHLRAEAAEERAEKAEAENRQRGGPPGEWVCDKCAFALHSRIINAQTGDIGVPRVQEIPDCLNGCGPLRPETWKGLCDSYGETIDRLNESCKQERERAEKAEKKITQFIHGEDRPDAYVTKEEAVALRTRLAAAEEHSARCEEAGAADHLRAEAAEEQAECYARGEQKVIGRLRERGAEVETLRARLIECEKKRDDYRAKWEDAVDGTGKSVTQTGAAIEVAEKWKERAEEADIKDREEYLIDMRAALDTSRTRLVEVEAECNEVTEELDAALERERGLRDALEAMCTCDAKSGYSCPYHRFVGS